jgi:aspartate kinase
MHTLVMKFGGSSIGMTTGLAQMVGVVLREREETKQLVLVVSALEGVTDALLDAAELARHSNRRGYRRIVGNLRTRHLALIHHFELNPADHASLMADLDRLLYETLDLCESLAKGAPDRIHEEALVDAVVSVGERLAARIVAALLRHHQVLSVAVDATDLIISDAEHSHATPDFDQSRERCRELLLPLLQRGIVPVVTGFIATGEHGLPTTLGRGGSDLSAAVLAAALDANEVWLWTNVDGLMTADPHDLLDARPLATVSYPELADLSFFGARIVHAGVTAPLAERRIGIRIRNLFRPHLPGTHIYSESAGGAAFKSVTASHGLALSADHSGPLHEAARHVDEALYELTGSHVEAMLTAQSAGRSVACFVIPISAGPDALHGLTRLAATRLSAGGAPSWQARPTGIVTLVGAMQADPPAALATALRELSGLHILAVALNPSGASLSIALDLADLPVALAHLHDLILATNPG